RDRADDGFIRKLKEGIPGLKEEFNVENCDFILVFCPVVSRPETDIQSALKKLQNLSSESKPVVLVVLHHTFNQELTVPDSSRSVNRENTLTVDCVFYEDRGLLQCYRNQEALEKVTQWIKHTESYYCNLHNTLYLHCCYTGSVYIGTVIPSLIPSSLLHYCLVSLVYLCSCCFVHLLSLILLFIILFCCICCNFGKESNVISILCMSCIYIQY
uniref:Uncharacterized protein n=1 Tax=Astyanax mexicanus TaxID=7994 RepID=A0A3B1J6A9_ASTMX